MAVNWTKEQKQVIDLRNRNILVSAAAGSGKTAVLVERIISMVIDEKRPIDIDRLLIVTFTKAAAGEMRERIGQALEICLAADPDNEHLQRQTNLIHRAKISTIDGFCSYIIRNYFHTIDLDPGFRMADEGELKLLKKDVVGEVLEQAYAEKTGSLHSFVESYSAGKTDEGIEDMILRLYEFSSSAPWPKEWLEDCRKSYEVKSFEDMEQSEWMHFLWKDIQALLQEAMDLARENLEIVKLETGPAMYTAMIEEDYAGLAYAIDAENFRELISRIRIFSFSRLSSKKNESVDVDLRERVKNNRERIKSIIKDMREQFFFMDTDLMFETIKKSREPVSELLRLTSLFIQAFDEKKREKNLLDFSDLEHLALKILVEPNPDGSFHMKEAARELSEQFEEIMIDEYQDSNLVQEVILTCVSASVRGEYNIFMVGDVKQSIYRFRQARPELFMEKLYSYTISDSLKQRVDLHKNFRSRGEVLRSVNFFFQQIMRKELGGVEYDKDAALYTGAAFPEGNHKDFSRTEILSVDTNTEEWMEEEKGLNNRELEARAIGERIRQMVGQELVWDRKREAYRPAHFGDCVILLRTMAGWAEVFSQVLIGMGIPAYSMSRTGYFSAVEVQTLLNFLQICDNPCQEIPYTAVLASPIVGCTPQELAMIRCVDKEIPFYECAKHYLEQGKDELLCEKLKSFFVLYEDVCRKISYTPIHELIWYLVEKSGYGDYVSALPGGEQRIANLRMLVEKAIDYENTSYGGLFHFIRYIENLKKYDVDFGEVNISGENDDTVRIMSIHKSKGLEFPIVFVAGMNKRFNLMDLNGPVVMDADFGVASIYVDYKQRVKVPSLMRNAFRRKLMKENLGEELRVLYVAMTRAKEKLILSGTTRDFWAQMEQYHYLEAREEAALPCSLLESASCYWSWILPALVRCGNRAPIDIHVINKSELVVDEAKHQGAKTLKKEELLSWDIHQVYDKKMKQILKERFSFRYPYWDQGDIPVKISVSELKKQQIQDEDAFMPYVEPDVVPLIPQFMQEKEEELAGAARGTAYHGFMEHLDFAKGEFECIRLQLEQAVEKGYLSEQEGEIIQIQDFADLLNSPLGQRMARAQQDGQLYREQPFVMGIPAAEMNSRWPQEETILIQGIIDAFFYEENEIILVDYKTDRARAGEEHKLVQKYKVQLDSYARALEKVTGKKVKEKILYSFTLKKAISIEN